MNTPTRYAIALMMASCVSSSAAWAIELSDVPLFLTTPLAPNIIVTLDTSGSMDAAHTPDGIGGDDDKKRYKSSYFNPMYYNPNVVYPQPRKYDGTFATTSFSSAWINGFDPTKGSGNLGTQYKPTKDYALTSSGNTYDSGQSFAAGTNPYAAAGSPTSYSYSCNVDFNNRSSGNDAIDINSGCAGAFANITTGTVLTVTGSTRAGTYTVTYVDDNRVTVGNLWSSDLNNQNVTLSWTGTGPAVLPAYYYRFDSGAAGCGGSKTDEDCYLPVQVSATSGPATADINDDGVINAADKNELQNFANWYSFYRVRTLAMITSANVSFWTVSPDARIAWQNLTTCNTLRAPRVKGAPEPITRITSRNSAARTETISTSGCSI
jgi:type IV pilus assembly protein PilY1